MTAVPGAGTYATRELLLAGALRDVSCCTWSEIAQLLAQDMSRARRLARMHRRCLLALPEYQALAASVVSGCIRMLSEP